MFSHVAGVDAEPVSSGSWGAWAPQEGVRGPPGTPLQPGWALWEAPRSSQGTEHTCSALPGSPEVEHVKRGSLGSPGVICTGVGSLWPYVLGEPAPEVLCQPENHCATHGDI